MPTTRSVQQTHLKAVLNTRRNHKGFVWERIDVKVRVPRQRSSSFVGREDGYELIRGELAFGARVIAPQTCMRWTPWGPNHDAAMRIGGEAPGRRAHSEQRLSGQAFARRTATSDRHGGPPRGRRWRRNLSSLTAAAVAHDADAGDPSGASPVVTIRHKRDEQLPRQGHDHGLARAAAGIRGPRPIPLRQRAVFLEQQEAPGQLHHAMAHAGIARLGQAFLPPLAPLSSGGRGGQRLAKPRADQLSQRWTLTLSLRGGPKYTCPHDPN